MMPAEDIERVVSSLNITPDAELGRRIIDDASKAQEEILGTGRLKLTGPWRLIMQTSRMAKMAMAAGLLLAVALGAYVLEKSAQPAWALEQTIAALENVARLKLRGTLTTASNQNIGFVLWAKPNKAGSASEWARWELEGKGEQLVVAQPDKEYWYWPGSNKVEIRSPGHLIIDPWLGKPFFETIKARSADWKETLYTDPNTRTQYVRAKCKSNDGNKEWEFMFDVQSKLPVQFVQRSLVKGSDMQVMNASEIVYNPEFPAGTFEFAVPNGAQVVDTRDAEPWPAFKYADVPNKGLDTASMSNEEACRRIVSDYMQAIVRKDWALVDRLRSSGGNAEQWKKLYTTGTSIKQVIEIGEPRQDAKCDLGLITPVRFRLADGSERTVNYVVVFNRRNEKRWCVIVGTFGDTREFQ